MFDRYSFWGGPGTHSTARWKPFAGKEKGPDRTGRTARTAAMPKAVSTEVVSTGRGWPPAPWTAKGSGRRESPRPTPASGCGRTRGGPSAFAGLLLFAALFPALLLPAALPAQEMPRTYQTHFATITYVDEKDLHTFTRNTGSGLSLFRESPERNPLLARAQVDKMVETICSLLDMYPANFRFGITLYRTQAEVTVAFLRATAGANAYKAQNTAGTAPIAFYAHGTKSIAVAIDNITDGILAHEIAHAVISAYFQTPPPGRMQEILAQYMDKHFRDK